MTYGEFLKGFIGAKGDLVWEAAGWSFRQRENGRDVLSAIFEDFVIVSSQTYENAVPLTAFNFNRDIRVKK